MRALPRTLLLVVACVLGPAAAVAHAGPGITFYPKDAPTLQLSGTQIAGLANLPPRTYTLPDSASQPGKKVSLRGLTISHLLAQGPVSAQRVQVVNEHGGSYAVTSAQFSTAILSDDGITTRYFRFSGGVLTDYTESDSVALEVSVDGGDLVVKAKGTPKRVRVGEPVRFDATVSSGVPGATYQYTWDFGDGPPKHGKSVTYTPKTAGQAFAVLDVRSSDPTCTKRCGGTDQATVEVGEAPEQPEDTTTGGANGAPGGAGSSGGGGTGGSGGGSGAGTATGGDDPSAADTKPEPKPEPKPPPPPPKPFGTTISGVLINDTGATSQKLPGGKPAGGEEGVRAVRGGETPGGFPLGLSGLLAAGVMWVGALRERRGVRLRVA